MQKVNLPVLAVVIAAHALAIQFAVREGVKGREHFTEVALMPALSRAPVMYAKASAPAVSSAVRSAQAKRESRATGSVDDVVEMN